MFRLRSYDQFIHPDHFKNKGALGLYIRALNWVRWKLETYIQKQVVIAMAREAQLPKPRVRELLHAFSVDVKAEAVEKEATSPLHPGLRRAHEEMPRASRYAEPAREPSLMESVAENVHQAPLRPQSLENLVGMYAVQGRHQRYTGNRRRVVDVDQFEPLVSDKLHEDEDTAS